MTTTVARDGETVLTVDFFTDRATADFTLPNGTRLLTLPISQLLGSVISQPLVDAMGTAAMYLAAQIVNSLTLTGGRRNLLQVSMNRPGCDYWIDTACTIPCCAKHDICYKENQCTIRSWRGLEGSNCNSCNGNVVYCILSSALLTCNQCRENTPAATSCYDSNCNVQYDCPGACPCLTLSTPPEGCCSCAPPSCETPTPNPTPTPSKVSSHKLAL